MTMLRKTFSTPGTDRIQPEIGPNRVIVRDNRSSGWCHFLLNESTSGLSVIPEGGEVVIWRRLGTGKSSTFAHFHRMKSGNGATHLVASLPQIPATAYLLRHFSFSIGLQISSSRKGRFLVGVEESLTSSSFCKGQAIPLQVHSRHLLQSFISPF